MADLHSFAASPALRRGLLFGVLAVTLSACGDPWLPGRGHTLDLRAASQSPPSTEKYCYRTLAEVSCYPAPIPDAEARRVGWADVADDSAGQ